MTPRLTDGMGGSDLAATQPESRPADSVEIPTLESADLFARGKTVCIRHQGHTYFLRLTRENKLILTK